MSGTRKNPLRSSEHGGQAALIIWARLCERHVPELRLLFAIPNQGAGRNKRLQQEGVSPGYPDLALDVARGGFHGLRIEMKTKGGRLSAVQKRWHELLAAQGFMVAICWDWPSARAYILEYLKRDAATGKRKG